MQYKLNDRFPSCLIHCFFATFLLPKKYYFSKLIIVQLSFTTLGLGKSVNVIEIGLRDGKTADERYLASRLRETANIRSPFA